MKLLRFHFSAPVHFGMSRIEYDRSESILHSDTLYAAIQQAWSMLGKPEWIDEEPDFALSSLFPFYRKKADETAVYFFPCLAGSGQPNSTQPELSKIVRGLRFVDQTAFEQLLHDGHLSVSDRANLLGEYYRSQPNVPEEVFMEKQVFARNRVPRFQEAGGATETEIYYLERVFFKDNSGLFCLFEGSEVAFNRVVAALRLLEDEGLGTDRHVGNGQFNLEIEDNFTIKLPENAKYCLNLSLFCPPDPETISTMLSEGDTCVAYNLIKRGGWITNEPFLTYRKDSIYMFREGSVFVRPNTEASNGIFIKGITHNLSPSSLELPEKRDVLHPIYRSGKSIFLPFNTQPS